MSGHSSRHCATGDRAAWRKSILEAPQREPKTLMPRALRAWSQHDHTYGCWSAGLCELPSHAATPATTLVVPRASRATGGDPPSVMELAAQPHVPDDLVYCALLRLRMASPLGHTSGRPRMRRVLHGRSGIFSREPRPRSRDRAAPGLFLPRHQARPVLISEP